MVKILKKIRISIITATKVIETGTVSYIWMFDSKAPRENYIGYKNWGILTIKDNTWIIQIGHGDKCILGGNIGNIKNGFKKDVLTLPESVILMQKEYLKPFKDAIGDTYQMVEYHYEGTLHTSQVR